MARRVALGVVTGALLSFAVLAGWGLSRLDTFPDQPARVIALAVLFAGASVGVASVRLRQETVKEVSAQTVIANLAGLLVLFGPFGLAWLDSHPTTLSWLRVSGSWFRSAGVVVLIAGTAVSISSLRSLGRWYSPRIAIQPGHQLVRTGSYRYIRHPLYSGFLLASLGLPACFGLWLGMPFVLASLVVLLPRMDQEEALLMTEFGAEYESMKQRTRRLIPRIY